MIYSLYGAMQHYAWGGQDYIPQLLGLKSNGEPCAEWWLGAHPAAPAELEIHGQRQKLADFLHENPQALGNESRQAFGDELPYLLKILDVAQPLSIQLHPTKAQAEEGFSRENAQGIALNDAKRTYKDRNHKPEMMIALSDFWLLHGFKSKAAIIESLSAHVSLQKLAKQLENQDLHAFYGEIMHADQARLAAWLLPIIDARQADFVAGLLPPNEPDYWLLYTLQAMNITRDKLDPGLLCFYLFNIVALKQGEGIYQAAGIPHAYLRGQNIELMACSDNVVRGGLTPKFVNIEELLRIVDCSEIEPQIIAAAPLQAEVFDYLTPAKDFALQHLALNAGKIGSHTAASAQIMLVMAGAVQLRDGNNVIHLRQGQSAFITADSRYQLETVAEGYAVVAKLP